MKKFVMADIHGNYKALMQCLERSKFDYQKDKLICLGDTCDGYPDVKECFDELLKIKNLVYILGNHDNWAMEWYTREMFDGNVPNVWWTSQGGENTLKSYSTSGMMDGKHQELLAKSVLFHVEHDYDDALLFVHGGINPSKPLEKQDREVLLWDRDLIKYARFKHYQKPDYRYGNFKDIYVGHTTTQGGGKTEPLHYCNVWMMDTGAGWTGKLTIMDIVTKEFWQSDLCKDLYPEGHGRGQ